jgi:hypothetical protein
MAVIMVVVITIMVSLVAVIVVLMVPMSLVHLPAFPVVVVVRMAPVGPFIGRTVPTSPNPLVMMTIWHPIPFHPDEAWPWNRPTLLVPDCRWRSPDVHGNLR